MSRIQAFGVALGLSVFVVASEQAVAGPFDVFVSSADANVSQEAIGTEGPILGQFPDFFGDDEISISIDSASSPSGGPVSASGSNEFGSGSGTAEFGVYKATATTTKVPDNTDTFSTRTNASSRDVFTVQSTSGQTGLVTVRATMSVSGRIEVPVTPVPPTDTSSIGGFPGFFYGFLLYTPLTAADMGPSTLNQFQDRRFLDGEFVENTLDGDCDEEFGQLVFCEAIDTHVFTKSADFSAMLSVDFVIEIGEMFSLENILFIQASSGDDGPSIEAEGIFGGLEVGPEFEIVADSEQLEKRDGIFNYGPAFDAQEPDVDPVAVPEPMTLALFGFGLAGLALTRRGRRR